MNREEKISRAFLIAQRIVLGKEEGIELVESIDTIRISLEDRKRMVCRFDATYYTDDVCDDVVVEVVMHPDFPKDVKTVTVFVLE